MANRGAMLYWLLMMIIMVIISHNDKLQIVSASCVRRLIQTMIWLTICEFYQTLWPYLVRRIHLQQQQQQHQVMAAGAVVETNRALMTSSSTSRQMGGTIAAALIMMQQPQAAARLPAEYLAARRAAR